MYSAQEDPLWHRWPLDSRSRACFKSAENNPNGKCQNVKHKASKPVGQVRVVVFTFSVWFVFLGLLGGRKNTPERSACMLGFVWFFWHFVIWKVKKLKKNQSEKYKWMWAAQTLNSESHFQLYEPDTLWNRPSMWHKTNEVFPGCSA